MSFLKSYFNDLTKNFNTYHSNLLQNVTKEDIHKLRTTLKKIKTFNILLDNILDIKSFFPVGLKSLFKTCGSIRDIQIQQELLEKYDDDYKGYLQNKYDKKISKFKISEDFTTELDIICIKVNGVDDYNTEEEIISKLKLYVESSYNEIRLLIQSISHENLHEIRIKVKRIYYTLLMLKELNDIDKIDNIQETIGLWHDYDVLIDCIVEYDNNLSLIVSLKQERDSLYNESLNLIKDI